MKFSRGNVLPSTKCISYKCKTCPQKSACDLIEELENDYEPLLYKPFENLMEIISKGDNSK